jgi:hypothetical protein
MTPPKSKTMTLSEIAASTFMIVEERSTKRIRNIFFMKARGSLRML